MFYIPSETVNIPAVYLDSMILFSLNMINLKYPDVYTQNENESPKFKDETGMWFHCWNRNAKWDRDAVNINDKAGVLMNSISLC